MADFPTVTLESLALPAKGSFAMGPFGSDIKTDNFVDFGVPIIKGQNLGGGRLLEDSFDYLTEEKADELSNSIAKSGDIVFTHRGTLGQVAMIPRQSRYPRYIVSQSQMKVSLDEKLALPEYVTYYFQSSLGQHVLMSYASQTGVPAIGQPLTSLRKMLVILPSIDEQRAIASVLGALDDKIESNQRQQSTLLGICHAAFNVALMNGTDVMKVEDMVRFRNNERKPLSAMERAGMERRYPYYGATGIFDYVEAFLFDDVNILIGEDGSVVNDDGTPVAQMAWGKYWVNNHAHVLSGKAVSTELAYIALARSDVRPLITGAVQLKINMGNLKSLEVALPSVEVRGNLDHEIQENLALWRAKSDESKMLVGLRDALLPELLSGRLRVKDAESMMESM